jgi:Na+/phosphate symporter
VIVFIQAIPELTPWERVLNTWVWPTVILIVVAFALRSTIKAIWPLAKQYVESLQKNALESQALLREQLNIVNLRVNQESKEIVDALKQMNERADERHREQTATMKEVRSALERVATKEEEIQSAVERNRRRGDE